MLSGCLPTKTCILCVVLVPFLLSHSTWPKKIKAISDPLRRLLVDSVEQSLESFSVDGIIESAREGLSGLNERQRLAYMREITCSYMICFTEILNINVNEEDVDVCIYYKVVFVV